MTKTIVIGLMLLASHNAQANDKPAQLAHGEKIHGEHCIKCHTDQVYTRDDRRVKSLQALATQVRRCRDNLGMQWFDDDTEAVVHFLNARYYKF